MTLLFRWQGQTTQGVTDPALPGTTGPQDRPHPPSLTTQPGRQWKAMNGHPFNVDLVDFELVTR